MASPSLYAIHPNGDLVWFRHVGREDGSFRWEGPKTVGIGWAGFEHVFSGGNGIIYAIEPVIPESVHVTGGTTPASGGRLLWYRHLGHQDGTFRWEGPNVVGTGWAGFEHAFSGGNGVIYLVEPVVPESVHMIGGTTPASGGNLRWYRHLGRDDGSFRWEGPARVGTGWAGLERVFAGDDGVIYMVERIVEGTIPFKGRATPPSGGGLRWCRHTGREDGTFRWQGPTRVGNGWAGFEHVCCGDDGVIYLVEPLVPEQVHLTGPTTPASGAHLRWYRHLGHVDGTFRWEGPKVVGDGWSGLKRFFSTRDNGPAATVNTGRMCEFLDGPGTPQIGLRSYLLKSRPRASSLTWSVSGMVNGVSAAAMQSSISDAFALWTNAVPALGFSQVPNGADITIGVGDLGAPDPITGSAKLGSTQPDGSAITLNSNPGVVFAAKNPGVRSLLGVAAHEIGHAIGILHSTTPGTLMFPFSSITENLADEDVRAARALYGWTPQSRVPGIGTDASPALCACGPSLVMAWKGIGADNRIYTARTNDGVNWSPQRPVPGTGTTDGPALAWDGATLWLALRGIPGDNALYWATTANLGDNWSGVTQISGTGSACAPSITIAGGFPLLVWRGIPGDDGLYYTTRQGQWAPQQRIGGTGSADRPSVCLGFDNLPRMVWRGIPGDDSLYTTTLIGQFWQPQQQLSWVIAGNGAAGTIGIGIPGSIVGPTITNGGDRVFLAWQGVPGDDAIYFTQAAPGPGGAPATEWSSQAIIEGIGTSHRPAIVVFQNLPFMAWKGVPNDNAIYTTRQVLK